VADGCGRGPQEVGGDAGLAALAKAVELELAAQSGRKVVRFRVKVVSRALRCFDALALCVPMYRRRDEGWIQCARLLQAPHDMLVLVAWRVAGGNRFRTRASSSSARDWRA
jgi:hypothetical protein